MQIDGKTALITGGASGLGAACARMVVGCGGPGLKVVKGAAVDIAGLEAHDRRSGRTRGEDAG